MPVRNSWEGNAHAQQLQVKEQEIGELTTRLQELDAAVEEGNAHAQQLQVKEQEIGELTARVQQLESDLHDNRERAQQLVTREEEIAQLSSEVQEKTGRITALEEQIESLDAAVQDDQQHIRLLEVRDQEINQLTMHIQELESAASEGNQHVQLLEMKQQEVSQLAGKIEELSAELQDSQERAQQLEAKEQEIARLEERARELEAALQSSAEHEQLLEAREQEVAELRDKLQELEAALRDKESLSGGLEAVPLARLDEPGVAVGAVHEEKLIEISQQDQLTGLFSRQHFMQVLEENLSHDDARNGDQSVFYILLDNFKSVRDDVGINASDSILRDTAGLIASNFGDHDTIARFSDYVFVVLHRGDDMDAAQKLPEKILNDIEHHVFETEGGSVMLKLSIGVCPVSEHTNTAQDVITRADLACEVARSSEGARIHSHNVTVDQQMSQEHEGEWDVMVRKTLEEERFYLVYQPIVSLNGDTSERYEVLLRILDDEGQVILPSQFLSIADKIGLTHEIDRWVINTAIGALAELHREGRETTFFVKISGKTLADGELPMWIHEKIRECQVETGNIVFEITEAVALKDLRNTMHFVNAMNKLGCKVALEHYGRANQPQLLKHLSVDIL
jgi:diguanylate cyclase (GGDEF)-like protein